MIFKYINPEIYARYAKAKQAYLEEIARDEKEKMQLAGSSSTTSEDKLLTAKEAAEMLAVSADWLYRNARKLPFTRKLAPKVLRFSLQGINKHLSTRKMQ
jgi:predicted DNA-binding transcriptional regulator AlpA